ncbi:replication initiation protein [Paraburkholderia phymatum]|uniref:Replication initiation protein n=1 Tax=Paraburkholderia phymatum TaxID=148447 RepID=A0ACC6U8S7_9BURK
MSKDVTTRATSRQLSLELFEEMLASDTPIHKSTKEIGYQRNNVFVDVTDVGVTARRLLDAAHFIVAQESTTPKYYDVELSYFRWLMRYDSYNYKHLRAVVSEAQKALIQVLATPPGSTSPENEKWVSVQLLGIVGIDKGRITFEVPQPLIRHIKDPEKSHWLSLRITSAFTLTYARAIYDHAIAYLADGITDWFEIDIVRSWPGKAGSTATVFKYFKRDSLEPAVKQINEVSDIELSYETRTESPKSKKIDRIRFRLSRKAGADAVRASLLGAQEIYTTLKNEFGFTEKQFNAISQNRAIWSDERILNAIEYTRAKIDGAQIKKSPSGYLMKAITEGYKLSEAERRMKKVLEKKNEQAQLEATVKEQAIASVAASAAAAEERTKTKAVEEAQSGRDIYEEAEGKTQKDLMRAFITSAAGKLAIKRLKLNQDTIRDSDVLDHKDLSFSFYQFVFLRNKPKANART